MGQNAEAIQLYFQAVDQSYDGELQSTGYWLAGQLSLEIGKLDEAIKTAARALSTARDEKQERLAAMTMGRALLLNNQPDSANRVLFDHRSAFTGSDLESAAAVLASYARLVGIEDKSRRFLFELAVQEKIAARFEQAASIFEFLIEDGWLFVDAKRPRISFAMSRMERGVSGKLKVERESEWVDPRP